MTVEGGQSLYSRDILRLATALPHGDRLANPDGSATRRSHICGSEVTVDVAVEGGRVTEIAIRANACALGQASAALLRDAAIGMTASEVQERMLSVQKGLAGEGEIAAGWSALAYARDYPARHGAILLPFETLLAAIGEARN